jgi:ketosteroid isomerase-like protein
VSSDEFPRLADEWADLVRRRDVEAARSFLADDFALASTGGVGSHVSRDDWLAALPRIESSSLACSSVRARVFGEVAVVHLRLRWEATMGARDLSGDYVVTDVFIRPGGRWRPSWRTSVRLAEGPGQR